MSETTRRNQYSTESELYLAFELANTEWKLGFTVGLGQNPRRRKIDAGHLIALQGEIRAAKTRR